MIKIQDELVNGNLSLDETAAGQEVQREIAAAQRQFQEDIQTLRQAQGQMARDSKETLARELAAQQWACEEQLASADKAQQSLNVSLESLLGQKTPEYQQLLSGVLADQQRLTEAVAQK
ncbi:hypothetical protein B0J13DRAFT_626780 [Dactylonectria estremocensis]|uniref:Uncharacterized protein n=1 Tax=Dactylonectria estremocensis TaxID=1079267 RepID=A0A9P9E6K7_9HYPO|nr:hypothetical protein B0J13DRAFT_626780 [Dactylonectria estremocensis]